MNKLFKLQRALLKVIDWYEKEIPERDEPGDWERVHMARSSAIGHDLAMKRGVDPLLAAAACSCHDYGRIITGKQKNHAEVGYEPVKEFLRGLEIFDEDQIEQIAVAVKNHSKKEEVGTPLEEIVKDADVLDCYRYDISLPRPSQRERLARLLEEGLS